MQRFRDREGMYIERDNNLNRIQIKYTISQRQFRDFIATLMYMIQLIRNNK